MRSPDWVLYHDWSERGVTVPVINAFQPISIQAELLAMPETRGVRRIDPLRRVAVRVPGARWMIWQRIDKPVQGRICAFLAHRPA
jgi:hypothetical protein